MGAITRAAANNITTGGVILPAGINDASVASITELAQVSAGDGITLISSQTASASASLSFTTGIDSTYRTYMFKFINIHPATDGATFRLIGSTNGGSSYGVATTTAFTEALVDEAGNYGEVRYDTGNDVAQSSSAFALSTNMGNDNDKSLSGFLYLFSPSSTTYVKHFISCSNGVDGSPTPYTKNDFVAGYINTTSAINAVQFSMSSGNIDAGTIYMYGIE
jgi:hypothetical protein